MRSKKMSEVLAHNSVIFHIVLKSADVSTTLRKLIAVFESDDTSLITDTAKRIMTCITE